MGAFVEGVWQLRLQYIFFKPILFPFFISFRFLRNELKATVLVWFPYNDSVTHKYLAKMRILARDETPFLSAVQLRVTTLAWWLDDGNFIPLYIHDYDSLTCDETKNSIIYSCGSPFSYRESFHCFLGESLGEASGRFIHRILSFLSNINPSGHSSPSSHRMRDNPFLGQYTLNSKETRKWGI
jgi:hypothetical protein